jgi:4-aminobutyrate aminotransferase-like enzyme
VGNPVACAAANAVLRVIDEEGLLERSEQIGKMVRARWDQIGAEVPEVGEIRGLGAMIGVEFVRDRATKAPFPEYLDALLRESLSRGLVTVSCGLYHNVLRHLIPLVISDDDLEEGLDVLAASAASARRSAGIRDRAAEVEGD